jgi:hypothetical protein
MWKNVGMFWGWQMLNVVTSCGSIAGSIAVSKTAGGGPDAATEIEARGNGGQVNEKG